MAASPLGPPSSPPDQPAAARRPADVCILDSQRALAEALAGALLAESEIRSAVGTSSPASAAAAIDTGKVDVLVVGTDSAGWEPLEFMYEATHRNTDLVVVAMSGSDDPAEVKAAVLAGATTWIAKQMHLRELVTVVIGAWHGDAYIPPAMLRRVLQLFAQAAPMPRQSSVFATLTQRETEILKYAAQGLTRAEIAEELGLSLNTVRTHIQHIMSKVHAHSLLEVVTRVLHEQPGES